MKVKEKNWWEDIRLCPIPKDVLSYELGLAWPQVYFAVHPHLHEDVCQYDVEWDTGPSNEDVADFVSSKFGSFPQKDSGDVLVTLHRIQGIKLKAG